MKSTPILLCAFLFLAAAGLPACSGSSTASVSGHGQLDINLTDAPIDLSNVASVVVDISAVTVYPGDPEMSGTDGTEAAPIVVLDHPATFDLLTLTGGATALLASASLPAGLYQRIRLDITSARMTFKDATTTNLKIDSNKVDIPIRFQVRQAETTGVTLDFDAGASVQVNDTGSGTFILRPVVTPVGS
jgi:Domain of unknown function (DUF4382)